METEYTCKTITKLLANIENGNLTIPSFQRSFDWSSNDIANLWTSVIIKNEPLGSIIIWNDPDSEIKIPQINEVFKQINQSNQNYGNSINNYLIDGQQRITSFAMSYLKFKNENAKFISKSNKIYLDLSNTCDIRFISSEKNSKKMIPISLLWNDKKDLMKKLEKIVNQENFEDLNKESIILLICEVIHYSEKLKKIHLGCIEITSNDLNSIIDVFTMINTKGKKLSVFNIVNAYYNKINNKFNLDDEFQKIRNNLKVKFGNKWNLNDSLLLIMLYAYCDKQINNKEILRLSEKITENTKSKISLIKCGKFEEYIMDTISFLIEINFPCLSLLPSNCYLYLVIGYLGYIHKSKNIFVCNKDDFMKISDFLKFCVLNNRHTSGQDGLKPSGFLSDLDHLCTNSKLEWKFHNRKFNKNDLLDEEYNSGSVKSKYILCLIISEIKSFYSGTNVKINNEAKYKLNFHHIFARNNPNNKNIEAINCLANITPLEEKINKEIGSHNPNNYKDKYIKYSKDSFINLSYLENFDDLMKWRAEEITNILNNFDHKN